MTRDEFVALRMKNAEDKAAVEWEQLREKMASSQWNEVNDLHSKIVGCNQMDERIKKHGLENPLFAFEVTRMSVLIMLALYPGMKNALPVTPQDIEKGAAIVKEVFIEFASGICGEEKRRPQKSSGRQKKRPEQAL